jgi:hypothetical protein
MGDDLLPSTLVEWAVVATLAASYVWFFASRLLLWEMASDWCLTPIDPALGYDATLWTWLTVGDLNHEGLLDVRFFFPDSSPDTGET